GGVTMHLPPRLAFPCLVLLAAGCHDGVSGARFRIVAEGAGTTNAEALEPLRPGSVMARDDAPGSVATVEDEVEIDGTHVRRLLSATDAAWYALSDDGVFLVGPHPDTGGKREHPILMVPRVVRPGMAWDVWPTDADGEARYHFTVADRSDDLTLEGRHA